MRPIALSDAELDAVLRAAAPIARHRRDSFLKAVANALANCSELGPGTVFRAIATTQRLYLDPPLATEDEEGHHRRRVTASKYG